MTCADISTKRIYRGQISIGKMFNIVQQERQIKTKMKWHYVNSRIAKTKNSDNKHWWGCRETGLLRHCW